MPDNIIDFIRNKRLQEMLMTPAPPLDSPPELQASNAAISPAVKVPTNTPTVGPSHFSQREYEGMVKQEPMRADYKPSKLRQVLSAVAGVGAGLGGDTEKAGKVSSDMLYAPFNKNMQDYSQQLAQKKRIYDTESEAENTQIKQTELGNKSAAEVARAQAEEARRKQLEHKATEFVPTSEDQAIRLNQSKHPSASKGPFLVELQDGTKIQGATFNPVNGRYTDPSSGIEINPKAITRANSHEVAEPKIGSPFEASYNTWKKEHAGQEPNSAELDKLIASTSGAARDPMAESLKAAMLQQVNMNNQRMQSEFDPQAVDFHINQMEQNPDEYHKLDAKLKPLVANGWIKKTGLPIPNELPNDLKGREQAAYMTKINVEKARKILTDPAMSKYIGPTLGNLGKLEQTAGMNLRGAPPEVVQKAEQLRGTLQYLLLGEARAALGSRPPAALVKELTKVSPDVHMIMPMLHGAIDNAEFQAHSAQKANEQYRFGGKNRSSFDEQKTSASQQRPKSLVVNGETWVINPATGNYRKQ